MMNQTNDRPNDQVKASDVLNWLGSNFWRSLTQLKVRRSTNRINGGDGHRHTVWGTWTFTFTKLNTHWTHTELSSSSSSRFWYVGWGGKESGDSVTGVENELRMRVTARLLQLQLLLLLAMVPNTYAHILQMLAKRQHSKDCASTLQPRVWSVNPKAGLQSRASAAAAGSLCLLPTSTTTVHAFSIWGAMVVVLVVLVVVVVVVVVAVFEEQPTFGQLANGKALRTDTHTHTHTHTLLSLNNGTLWNGTLNGKLCWIVCWDVCWTWLRLSWGGLTSDRHLAPWWFFFWKPYHASEEEKERIWQLLLGRRGWSGGSRQNFRFACQMDWTHWSEAYYFVLIKY